MLLSASAKDQLEQYSTSTAGGAPTPNSPTPPASLDLQNPSIIISEQAPSLQERSQDVMMTDEQSAYAAALESSLPLRPARPTLR